MEMWTHFGKPHFPEIADKYSPALWCAAGFVTLADWLGSDENYFPPDEVQSEDILRQQALRAVDAIGLGLPPVKQGLSFGDIFSGRTPYPLQEEAASVITGPGIYIVEAPMGMGKTEAALWASYHLLARGTADGIFFALPTQATSNRMFLRFADFVKQICPESSPVQLVHGSSWLQDDLAALAYSSEDENVTCWFNSPRRSLFAPFGVGTVDQALMAVLAVRHFALRRFALSGKIVVIDEVHTYDMYTGTLIRYLCDELQKLGCTIIILSATLTERARCALLSLPNCPAGNSPYPRISGRQAAGPVLPDRCPPSIPDRTVAIEHMDRDLAMSTALELAGRGAQVLWVCDTIERAQHCFTALRDRAGQSTAVQIGLLHSRFPFYQRADLENEWMTLLGADGDRSRGRILVSTQIVEQSVDLDADVLISELAPTDMLLQRLGRLWRHLRTNRPVSQPLLIIVNIMARCDELRHMSTSDIKKIFGKMAYVYSPYAMLRTLERWEAMHSLVIPSGIRELMELTYEEQEIPHGWEELHERDYGKDLTGRMLAGRHTDIWMDALDDAVMPPRTRLSAHDDVVMVLCTAQNAGALTLLDGSSVTLASGGRKSLETAKKLHRNTIRIPAHYLAGRTEDSRLSPYHINGLLLVNDNGVISANTRSGKTIRWDTMLGLVIA